MRTWHIEVNKQPYYLIFKKGHDGPFPHRPYSVRVGCDNELIAVRSFISTLAGAVLYAYNTIKYSEQQANREMPDGLLLRMLLTADAALKMTPKQQEALGRIYDYVRHYSGAKRNPELIAVKSVSATRYEDGTCSVLAVSGAIKDSTALSLAAHAVYTYFIGPRGGLFSYNNDSKRVSGSDALKQGNNHLQRITNSG